ncbi:MAG: hypothetical protein A2231_00170 [Candidatus Firestonebacteria bacterium RIFOXYA2_FULL_40_8]|nr:MAG: hypothetical protein A2231_00170 [Candidatus Firestonebacteria bacterium RIFOXYA2_FULL_40_8]
MSKWKIALMVTVMAAGLLLSVSCAKKEMLAGEAKTVESEEIASPEDALEKAKKDGTYLYVYFYEKNDEALTAMEKEIEAFRKEITAKTMIYKAVVSYVKDTEMVQKYSLDKVKLPAVMSFAPNGVITGGFPETVTRQELDKTIISALDMKIMRILQDGKMVLVLVQNAKTKSNKESTDSAEAFKSDSAVKDLVDSIIVDPSVKENKLFLTACRLDENIEEASMVVLVPPGAITGIFKGKVEKETILESLEGGTCGPEGGADGCAPNTPGCGQ